MSVKEKGKFGVLEVASFPMKTREAEHEMFCDFCRMA
jgi:hypothetical protein